MFGVKVASTSTSEIIKKLQEYEKEHGIGAVTSIATVCSGDRTVEYIFYIANDSHSNKILAKDKKYEETSIEISSINDNLLFPDRYEIAK